MLKRGLRSDILKRLYSGRRRIVSEEENLDPFQEALLNEECILVDENDRELGSATKRHCHLKLSGENKAPLHRAFSIFIFNKDDQLLMQQRSDTKVTFPGKKMTILRYYPERSEAERSCQRHRSGGEALPRHIENAKMKYLVKKLG